MKPKKLFYRLFPPYFLISLIGLILLLVITRFAFENFYYQEMSTSLTQKAKLIEKSISKDVKSLNKKELQYKIVQLSVTSENRITLIDPQGIVLADSNYDPEKMENHNDREEIIQAIKGKVGQSVRYSSTLNKKHLYIAIPLKVDGKLVGVLRNSVTVDELQNSLIELTNKVLLWSALLLVLLTFFIYEQAKKISTPLENLKEQVESFSIDDFDKEINIQKTSTEEVAHLSDAVQKMGLKLQAQFKKINKQKNEQLSVFASMLEGVITIYPDMNIYHINRAALNLFKYDSKKHIKGTPLKEVVKSERIYQMAKQLLKDHNTVVNEFEYESGTVLNVHGTILESETTGMLGAVLVFNDVTKVRELENHRKDFVANVSHELKTPLTAIQGYIETIQEEQIDDKEMLDRFIGVIGRHSLRLKGIIEDLLTLSSIEKDSEIGGLNLVEQGVNSVIENAISVCQQKALKKNIEVVIRGDNLKAKINAPLLEQAIINLLDNAIKYGPENTKVFIDIRKKVKTLEIVVIDKGNGIPKEHLERLFERFYSVDKARSRELGGSGLGLSIVKHIALSHGGKVSVESQVGRGSSFSIELPM